MDSTRKIPKYLLSWLCVFLVSGCAVPSRSPVSEPSRPPEPSSVAVWDLENMSPDKPFSMNRGELLSAGIIQVFQESDNYTVVEREKLLRLLEELQLGSSELAGDETRLRLGRLVGAQRMVFGGYLVMGEIMRLDLRLVDVETGAVVNATHRILSAADPAAGLNAAKEAARELIVEKVY